MLSGRHQRDAQQCSCSTPVRRPTMEPFFVKSYCDFEAASLGTLVFRGTFRPIWHDFDPVWTNSDLFWAISPGRPDLFRPIRRPDLTYFHVFRPISFHTKAPWTGHLTPVHRAAERTPHFQECSAMPLRHWKITRKQNATEHPPFFIIRAGQ